MPNVKAAITVNRLLSALPRVDRQRILGMCERVELVLGDILCEAGKTQRYVYFPTGGNISLVTPLDACPGIEVGFVGSEGMAGLPLLFGLTRSPLLNVVQGAGSALRMTAATFRREIGRGKALRRRLNRYAYVNMQQLALTAACVRFHVVEARLARWLLTAQDRSRADSFHATHEFLAYMLGVRRVGITKAATALQKQALIRYRRGNIKILDRQGLEAKSCDCYPAAKELYERILG